MTFHSFNLDTITLNLYLTYIMTYIMTIFDGVNQF